jgi:hypothetical protein
MSTPRTDNLIYVRATMEGISDTAALLTFQDFARNLEKENAELKRLVATLAGAINNCNQANVGAICRHTIGVTAALESAKELK